MLTTRSFAAFALSAAAIIAVACGDNGNPQPTGSTGAGAGGSMVVTSSTTTSGTTSTTSGTMSSTTSTTSGGGGCFMGNPTTNDDYLNACNGLTCQPFDNSKAKLPLINSDGTLPPLPM